MLLLLLGLDFILITKQLYDLVYNIKRSFQKLLGICKNLCWIYSFLALFCNLLGLIYKMMQHETRRHLIITGRGLAWSQVWAVTFAAQTDGITTPT